MDNGPFANEVDLPGLCVRIELRISGNYDHRDVVELLTRTCNVEVFILRNVWSTYPILPDRECPDSIVEALAQHSSMLRRVQFETRFEEPSLEHIKSLLISAPSLISLHVDRFAESVSDEAIQPFQDPLPMLEVISLGNTMRQPPWAVFYPRVEELLPCFPTPNLLPSLDGFYIQRFSPAVRPFLEVFGAQLGELAFSSADLWVATSVGAGHLMEYCTTLRRAICVAPEGPAWDVFHPLPQHKTVEDLEVVYAHRGHPSRGGGDVLRRGLLQLNRSLKALVRVTVVVSGVPLSIHSTRWYRASRRALRKDGISLRELAVLE